jgi:hypothetical protein
MIAFSVIVIDAAARFFRSSIDGDNRSAIVTLLAGLALPSGPAYQQPVRQGNAACAAFTVFRNKWGYMADSG